VDQSTLRLMGQLATVLYLAAFIYLGIRLYRHRGRGFYAWLFLLCAKVSLLCQLFGGAIAFMLTRPAATHPLRFNALARPLAMLLMILSFGMMARLMDKRPGGMFEAQGLGTQGGWLPNSALGVVIGALSVVLAVAGVVAMGSYTAVFSPNYLHLAVITWICITAAALEEVATRGYPFQTLAKSIGTWPAAMVLSLIFGALHLLNPNHSWLGFANTVFVGMLLAFMVIRTGTLWMAIGFHFAWNFTLGTLFGLPVSGVDIFLAGVSGKAEGPLLLTGGDYGIEASLTGTLVILLGFVPVYLLTRKSSMTAETSAAI